MVLLGFSVLFVSLSCALYRFGIPLQVRHNLPWSTTRQSKAALDDLPKSDDTDGVEEDGSLAPTITLNVNECPVNDAPPKKEKGTNQSTNIDSTAQRALSPKKANMDSSSSLEIKPQSEQRHAPASSMPPPPRPTPKSSSLKIPPKPATSLQPPPSAASSLRAPPPSSLKSSNTSLAPSISTLAPANRASKKVLLDPGHSPLDWAHLTANPPTKTFLRGDDVPPNLIRVPPSALRYHSGRKGKNAWGVYQGKVYNLSPYMKFHPGGVDQLMRGAGREKDGEKLFNEIHPWVSWENMLGECLIGILVSEDDVKADGGQVTSKMDEMD